jgi:hypothetical protein
MYRSADSGSESDESEDEDGEQLTLGLDLEIMRTINRIRKKVSVEAKQRVVVLHQLLVRVVL